MSSSGGRGAWGQSSTAKFSGSGSPLGVVTPTRAGDLYVDDTTPALWQATGVLDTDWQSVGGGGGGSEATFAIFGVPGSGIAANASSPTVLVPIGVGLPAAGFTVISLPSVVAPAGQVSGPNSLSWSTIPTFAGRLQVTYTEIAITNLTGTEAKIYSNASPIADLTSGQAAGHWTDFGNSFGAVGTDLTDDGAGNIFSTAGGVFVAQYTVSVIWT